MERHKKNVFTGANGPTMKLYVLKLTIGRAESVANMIMPSLQAGPMLLRVHQFGCTLFSVNFHRAPMSMQTAARS